MLVEKLRALIIVPSISKSIDFRDLELKTQEGNSNGSGLPGTGSQPAVASKETASRACLPAKTERFSTRHPTALRIQAQTWRASYSLQFGMLICRLNWRYGNSQLILRVCNCTLSTLSLQSRWEKKLYKEASRSNRFSKVAVESEGNSEKFKVGIEEQTCPHLFDKFSTRMTSEKERGDRIRWITSSGRALNLSPLYSALASLFSISSEAEAGGAYL